MAQPQEQKTTTPKKRSGFRWFRLIAWILLLSFITIQFFQVDKNNNSLSLQNDITALVNVPVAVQASLQAACYDCHSNNTNYPWYTNIQPVGWWLRNHIDHGKRGLNFNEFATYSPVKQREKLGEIKDSQRDGWMPLNSYTWIHKEAKLSDNQKQQIIRWAEEAQAKIDSAR